MMHGVVSKVYDDFLPLRLRDPAPCEMVDVLGALGRTRIQQTEEICKNIAQFKKEYVPHYVNESRRLVRRERIKPLFEFTCVSLVICVYMVRLESAGGYIMLLNFKSHGLDRRSIRAILEFVDNLNFIASNTANIEVESADGAIIIHTDEPVASARTKRGKTKLTGRRLEEAFAPRIPELNVIIQAKSLAIMTDVLEAILCWREQNIIVNVLLPLEVKHARTCVWDYYSEAATPLTTFHDAMASSFQQSRSVTTLELLLKIAGLPLHWDSLRFTASRDRYETELFAIAIQATANGRGQRVDFFSSIKWKRSTIAALQSRGATARTAALTASSSIMSQRDFNIIWQTVVTYDAAAHDSDVYWIFDLIFGDEKVSIPAVLEFVREILKLADENWEWGAATLTMDFEVMLHLPHAESTTVANTAELIHRKAAQTTRMESTRAFMAVADAMGMRTSTLAACLRADAESVPLTDSDLLPVNPRVRKLIARRENAGLAGGVRARTKSKARPRSKSRSKARARSRRQSRSRSSRAKRRRN